MPLFKISGLLLHGMRSMIIPLTNLRRAIALLDIKGDRSFSKLV
ncbi:hypothetical protein [Microcoleus sp. AT3-A2]